MFWSIFPLIIPPVDYDSLQVKDVTVTEFDRYYGGRYGTSYDYIRTTEGEKYNLSGSYQLGQLQELLTEGKTVTIKWYKNKPFWTLLIEEMYVDGERVVAYNDDEPEDWRLCQFLLKCLLFTCLEMQNHMRTFTGSDDRFYRNELCLDTSNGETIASKDLKKLKIGEKEIELFEMWKAVLKWAKKTENYNPNYTYGVYQIFAELNSFTADEETGEKKPDYPELNGALKSLKQKVKEYYNFEIVPILFEYELLK